MILLKTYTALTVWRVVLLYIVMMLCRFAFGSDVLNEPCDDPAAIIFDGDYKAVTDRYLYSFDDNSVKSVYALGDVERYDNLIGKVPHDDMERRIKAFIQQYYGRMKRKNYIADDKVRPYNDREQERFR